MASAPRICPNCGKPSPARRSPRGPAPLYCDDLCKRQMNNRMITDGAALVPYLKAWRVDRGSGPIAKASFARICRIVDDLNDQDRQAGRPRANIYAATLLESNAPTVDELRYGRRKVAHGKARALAEADPAQPAPEAAPAQPPAPVQPDLAEILRMIADGHNDPRALAAAALGR